ncbi:hypothetical protein NKR23_g9022 [Pleurostoma richardsiae]|uniref:Cyclin N-terminal domain-containing protein n=1 Tax=Pleurostoma richardsiae TaxID=41990 RepID=A0AA38R7U1_9PEZI|nr:hypothetical protein NKR23_g9022 [Pleurostoma richardsiae]
MEALQTRRALPARIPGGPDMAALYRCFPGPATRVIVSFLASFTLTVVKRQPYVSRRHGSAASPCTCCRYYPLGPSSKARSKDASVTLPSLESYIGFVVSASHTSVPALMGAFVYLRRLKSLLRPTPQDFPCAAHRLFLASLMLAARYVGEARENQRWAGYSLMRTGSYIFGFSHGEVNCAEDQLRKLLGRALSIDADDFWRESGPFRRRFYQTSSSPGDVARPRQVGGVDGDDRDWLEDAGQGEDMLHRTGRAARGNRMTSAVCEIG